MSKRVKARPRASQVDMAQKALAEYEEAERRRYHERLRAEKKGAPMQITQEERDRVTAMAIIDVVNDQYAELVRTGRCPACEQIVTWEEVEKHPVHALNEDMAGQEASEYLQWTSKHLEDCTFYPAYQELPLLAARFHIVIAMHQIDLQMPRPDGKVTRDLVPIRVPAPGDPPVAPGSLKEDDDDNA
jgi:hypothetical protein